MLARLRSPRTIRERCERILAAVEGGESPHFRVDRARLDPAADRVADLTRKRYPDLAVPYHSRWRHFEAAGIDRHGRLRRRLVERTRSDPRGDRFAATRALIDLAVVSVLLDAGAGAAWRYRESCAGDPTEGSRPIGRSEGLAIASLAAFEAGVFSSDPADPWRVDAAALRSLDAATLARVFQVDAANPLVGLEGRTRLMNALGDALAAGPRWFGPDGRPGGLVDALLPAVSAPAALEATAILDALLQGLAPIWPSGQRLDGIALGDCWRHPHATPPGHPHADAGWVPFHKLSQWLTYSLLEPFAWAGVPVGGLAELTGLPEYRNGGLLIDAGVLVLRDPATAATPQPVGSRTRRRMACADGGADRPDRGRRPGASAAAGGRVGAAARGDPGGRHLGRRP